MYFKHSLTKEMKLFNICSVTLLLYKRNVTGIIAR